MKHLLDVNLLLAAIWQHHPHHAAAATWLAGKQVTLCPIAELGFIRISTNPKAYGATMEKSRTLLELFAKERKAVHIADDLPALDANPCTSDQVTDHYLAALAEKHNLKLATFDIGIKHAAVVIVS